MFFFLLFFFKNNNIKIHRQSHLGAPYNNHTFQRFAGGAWYEVVCSRVSVPLLTFVGGVWVQTLSNVPPMNICRRPLSFPDNNHFQVICVISYYPAMKIQTSEEINEAELKINQSLKMSWLQDMIVGCILSLRLLLIFFIQAVVYAG